MSVPGIVQSTLDGEEIASRVSLGGEDELFVTSSSTLVYRSEGILSDESINEFPHDADRLTISEGRRKTTISLEYSLEGVKEFSIPSSKTDAVLHPVLAGVLNGNGITEAGETVIQTYRFSELTVIITSNRLVKHIGAAVWDTDFEEYHFDDVTNLAFEDGSVATQIVLTVNGRQQRIKAPNEQARDLRERLKRALFDYHGVSSLEELNRKLGGDEPAQGEARETVDFSEGVDPLNANPPEPDDEVVDEAAGRSTDAGPDAGAVAGADAGEMAADAGEMAADAATESATAGSPDVETGDSATDSATPSESVSESTGELVERIDSLEAAVDEQSELIERQQELLEELLEELRGDGERDEAR